MNRRWLSPLLLVAMFGTAVASGAVRVAYTRLDNGQWQVWMAEAAGANPRRVTSSPWDKRCLRAGDGANLLLMRDNEGKLHRLDLADKTDAQLALDFEVIKDFDVNPRSGYLIASYAPNALDNVCLWQVPVALRSKRLLIPDPYLNESPRWFPDGNSFLFVKSHAGRSQLWVSDLAQVKARAFLQHPFGDASDPCPNPDGTRVVFCGEGRTSMDLWICSNTGANIRELYAGPGLEAEPAWSLDGEWVYFTTWDGQNFRVARIRPTGKEFTYISTAGVDCRCPVVISAMGEQHE